MMIVRNTLPRALEHLVVIEAEAPVREAATLTASVDSIMTREVTYCRIHEILLDVWSVMRNGVCNVFRSSTKHEGPLGIIYAREALQAPLSESENEDELLRDYISGVGYG